MDRRRAFTLIEVLLVVSVIAVLGGAAYQGAVQLRRQTENAKLENDVRTINRSIPLYIADGGRFDGTEDAEAVIAKLKTRRNADSAAVSQFLTGDLIDRRIALEMQSEEEAASDVPRARWNGEGFEVIPGPGAAGIRRFYLDERLAAQTPATESRSDSLQAHDVRQGPGWVWDYTNAPVVASADGATPATAAPTVTPVPNPYPSATPTPTPVRIAISPVISGPSVVTYQQAGGTLSNGAASQTAFITASVSGSIPAANAGQVTVTAEVGATTGAGTDQTAANLALSTSAFSSESLTATATLTADPATFDISGNPASLAISIQKTTLPTPMITVVMGLNTSFFVSPGDLAGLPAGYILRYSTDGSELSSATSGNAYTGQVVLSETSITVIKARIFAPTASAIWFNSSAQASSTYTPGANPSALPIGVLLGSLSNLNGTFNGNVVIAYSNNISGFNINSGAKINGSLYLPGTPSIYSNNATGGPAYWSIANDSRFSKVILGQGTTDSSPYRVVDMGGNTAPTNYQIGLDAVPSVTGKIYRQIERFALTPFDTSKFPAKQSKDSKNDLTTNQSVTAATNSSFYVKNGARVTMAAGSYGDITIDNGTLVLGNAGSLDTVQEYSFENLTLNSSANIEIVGKVVINIKNSTNVNGGVIGNSSHPEWLQINFWSGGTVLNSGTVYGAINAPSGGVTVNSKLVGSISAQSLNINGSGSVTVSLRPPQ